jgi:hypothetical protein
MAFVFVGIFALIGIGLLFAKERGWGLTVLLLALMVLLWRVG